MPPSMERSTSIDSKDTHKYSNSLHFLRPSPFRSSSNDTYLSRYPPACRPPRSSPQPSSQTPPSPCLSTQSLSLSFLSPSLWPCCRPRSPFLSPSLVPSSRLSTSDTSRSPTPKPRFLASNRR
jgi:hypothetical protein